LLNIDENKGRLVRSTLLVESLTNHADQSGSLNHRWSELYCIVFKHVYGASSVVNSSEALPVCKAPWEKIGFEKCKG